MPTKKFIVVFLALVIFCAIFVQLSSLYLYRTRTSSLPLNIVNRYKDTFLKIEHSGNQLEVVSTETRTSLQYHQMKTLVEKSSLIRETKRNSSRLFWGSPNTSTNNSVDGTGDWEEGTFCHQFLVNTFQLPIPICGSTLLQSSVNCFGSPYSHHMGTCILKNVVISPRLLAKAMIDADHTKFIRSEPSIALLGGCGTECNLPSLDKLKHRMESGDYVWHVINKVKEEELQSASVCENWIEDDVFLFTAHRFHIYFRFLDYFNVHKLIEDLNHTLSHRYHIIRVSGSDDYHFPKFDKMLFPEVEVLTLDHLDDVKTCFKKVILVPKSYASILYQCKMPCSAQLKCADCNGKGLMNTQISSFRERVLKACSLSNRSVTYGRNFSIIFVSRQPYLRNKNDKIDHFERVMDNEKELLLGLKYHFNTTVVQRVHLEDLGLCEQIRIVHNSDIYMGVHGAGLVHLWWLKEDSLVYEMVPHYETGNPTFDTLARLSGRRYHSSQIGGKLKAVHAQVSEIVKDLDKYSSL